MAKISNKTTVEKTPTLSSNQRWVYGFILLFLSLFLLGSVICYYFYWDVDQSVVRWGSMWSKDASDVANPMGKFGAFIADKIVGKGFGFFGVAIALFLLLLSLRVMRFKSLLIRKSLYLSLLIMILGSITLGYVFGTKWGFYGSGLGGVHGIYMAELLGSYVGVVGTGLLLLLLWVLLAVYINRSTINVVNSVGKGIVGSAEALASSGVEILKRTPKQQGQEDVEEDQEEEAKDENEDQKRPFATLLNEPDFEINAKEGVYAEDKIVELSPVVPAIEQPKSDSPFEIVDTTATDEVKGIIQAGTVINEQEELEAPPKDILLDDQDIESTLYDPTKELSRYIIPPVELLEDHSVEVVVTEEEVYENKNQIIRTLDNFGIKIDKIKATIGPTVTLYEIVPAPGVRISKIKNLEDDIALSLSALGIRIIAPMPGKGTIGIEVPNKDKKIVSMYSVVKSLKFQESRYDLPVVLGKTIQNETFVIDLAKMPHLLVAGATGQGKSVGLNAIITSLLYKKHPAELKFVLVDPKKVELTLYQKLEKHFLAKMPDEEEAIITDTHRVVNTLNSICVEMDSRYDLLRKAEVRQIKEYNEKFTNRRLNPNKGHRYLPYIVVIIDEFADMIMTAGREIETPIARVAQLARAVGIHLVIATQRPTTNIITGVIKANFPARIAFKVSSMVDSRTIIDMPGANQLIGRGDMLVSSGSELVRVQCAFIDTPEVEKVVDFISKQQGYSHAAELPEYHPESQSSSSSKNIDNEDLDQMFEDVARFIVQNQTGSTSNIQRRFSIGYNRAGRIMDQMEANGIVGRAEGSKPREVLITDMATLERLLASMM